MNEPWLELSIVIITLNEEENLRRCLSSLPKGCEVIILDSGSSDQTAAIALSFGAHFETRVFDDYSAQKNAAIDLATRRWILSIDADEELNGLARESIAAVVRGPAKANVTAYKIKRGLVFLGQQMRFGKTSDYPIRLFQRAGARFLEPIHERLNVLPENVGPVLPGMLRHHSYKDLTDYFVKFNRYTSKIAVNHYRKKTALPNVFVHCLRPFVEFISRYIFRFGFLDGRPGFSYALFSATYAFVKYDKLREIYDRGEK